jgi:bleomycin hydrolase
LSKLELSHLPRFVPQIIKAGQPVFFGCDVGQSSHNAFGIMDTGLYDVETAFGIELGLNKADRLRTGESAMTHGEDGFPIYHRTV